MKKTFQQEVKNLDTSFNFYQETAEQLLGLDNETIGKFFRAIVENRLNDTPPPEMSGLEKMSYTLVKSQLDLDVDMRKKRSESGKKGGGQIGNQNAKKTKADFEEIPASAKSREDLINATKGK
jgi:hypothetical protein